MILISAREIPDWIYAKHQFVNLLKMNGFESLMSTSPLSGGRHSGADQTILCSQLLTRLGPSNI